MGEWTCPRGHVYDAVVYSRTNGQGCPKCCGRVSAAESEVSEFVSGMLSGVRVEKNVHDVIPPKELDIYVPEKHIAIEFNGLYWHSESAGKDRHYHYDKWRSCQDKGIQLITVWEDDWRDKRDIIKSMLRHKLGADHSDRVGARKCEVVTVSTDGARSFLGKHHVQGWVHSSVRLGLVHDGEIVALAAFRKRSEGIYELVRYATSANVQGGQSRLLKHFISSYHPSSIVTFADHEVSNGNLYARTGWVEDGEVKPDYRYVYDGRRQHKFGFRKERFERDPELLFDPSMTETELAELNGIPRVWDCGKTRWVMKT